MRPAAGGFPPSSAVRDCGNSCDLGHSTSGWKASRLLDLYERIWNRKLLTDEEFVISADEKTSVQARRRKPPTLAAQLNRAMRVEHEYKRCSAWAYLAALDVHQARVFGRCEPTIGIAPFDRLVAQVIHLVGGSPSNLINALLGNRP